MCGIAGYLRSEDTALRPEHLRPMCNRLVHRGPDGYKDFIDADVALGHRRLSIIDVQGGAQPLGNEDDTVQVVFNGEIYNHKEVRVLLEGKGHRFRTRTDTEVLVHLYEDFGEQMPEMLNGMFAFAIWDQRQKTLFLARDRFGEKPLYFSTSLSGFRICFASELKALILLPGVDKAIRPESIPEFLTHGYISDPATIYAQFKRLAPGTSMTIDWRDVRTRRYWAPHFDVEAGLRFGSAVEKFNHLAADAVKSRLMSDVPLGAFLSGGLDSSAIVTSMCDLQEDAQIEQVRTFSIGFDSAGFDERPYARLVAEKCRTNHREFVVTANIEEMLNLSLDHYDEPFGDSSAIPSLYLARLAREEVKVALSGDGADELFGGYSRYGEVIAASVREMLPQRFRHHAKTAEWAFDNLPSLFASADTREQLARSAVDHYHQWSCATDPGRLQQILSPDLSAAVGDYTPRAALADRFAAYKGLPLLHQMQAVDLETYLPGDILVKMDRATMAFSLESRAPWLDHRLAEFAGTLPAAFKRKGGVSKRVLRSAFQSRLPAATTSRAKMGFGPPVADWLRSSLKLLFEEAVFRSENSAYLNLTAVKELWQEHQSGANDYRIWILWNILILALWLRRRVGAL